MQKNTCTAQYSTVISVLIQAGNDSAHFTVCAPNGRRL